MKIVMFKDGTFGIRKGVFIYTYKDLKENYWWSTDSFIFKYCKGTLDEAKENFFIAEDKGTPIKINKTEEEEMKLNQMYKNVLSYVLTELITKIEEDSLKREAMLNEATAKNVIAARPKSVISTLSDQEKAILKALGLTAKSLKTLQGA